jgi:hypothetical protein
MMTVRYHCDRCGRLIEAGCVKLVAECGSTPATWSTDPASGRPDIDLCGPCPDELSTWVCEADARDGARDGAPVGA